MIKADFKQYLLFKDIYPSELELKKTALSHLKATYLDMDITFNQTNNQFHYTLYDNFNRLLS